MHPQNLREFHLKNHKVGGEEELVVEDGIYFEESLMVNPLQTLRRCAAKLDPAELKAAREETVAKAQKEKSRVKNRRAPVSRLS